MVVDRLNMQNNISEITLIENDHLGDWSPETFDESQGVEITWVTVGANVRATKVQKGMCLREGE